MAYGNQPHSVEETEGIKYYCTCGESANKPYCDGSHETQNTGKEPQEVIIEKDRRIAICDCGNTKTSPFCDGSHNS